MNFYKKSTFHFGKVVLFLSLLFGSGNAFSQDFLSENFNASTSIPTGWTAVNDGVPACPFQVTAPLTYSGENISMTGSNFAFCNGDPGGSGSETNATLTSPAFNTANSSILFLEFVQYYRDYSGTPTDSAIVEVFNGTRWVKVQSLDVTTGAAGAPVPAKINVTAYKNAAMKVRFRSVGIWPWYWAFDNVKVSSPVPNDIGVTAVISPSGDCGLSAATQILVQVTNFGSASQPSVPISYRVNGGAVVSQTFTTPLAAGAVGEYTFTTTQDMNAPGDYFISAWTGLATDLNKPNDSTLNAKATKAGNTFTPVNFSNFNGDNLSTLFPGWKERSGVPPAGTTSAWRQTADEQTAALGSTAAAINLYTNTRREWMISTGVKPVATSGLSFKLALTNWLTPEPDNMGSDDSLKIMVTTNCENSWTTIQSFTVNSNLTNALKEFKIPLSQYAGQEIKIAFFATDGVVDDVPDYDLILDDIALVDIPAKDLSVTAVLEPVSGCGLTSPNLKVSIKNAGSAAQSNFSVCYKLNGGAEVCAPYAQELLPNQEAEFTFPAIAALSQPGLYTFDVYSKLTGDLNLTNDSVKNFVFQNILSVTTFPYTESFENGNGGWIPGGKFSTWALGTPQKGVIQGAADGTNSYVTGGLGTGKYNSNEKSFVVGPCMNFSTLTNPTIELKVWWNTEFSEDGAILQSSTDGGTTWANVGTIGSGLNWYTDNSLDGMIGLAFPRIGWSGGWADNFGTTNWVTARINTPGLAGLANVRLRIAFGANATNAGDGFAFDAVKIYDKLNTDLSLQALTNPSVFGCNLSDTTRIRIQVKNSGLLALSDIPVAYSINGGSVRQATIPGPIAPDAVLTFGFPQTENMSNANTYSIKVWSAIAADEFKDNDTLKNIQTKKRIGFTDTLKFEGFDGNNLNTAQDGWNEFQGADASFPNSSWRNSSPVQTSFYKSTTARVNIVGFQAYEWMIGPALKLQSNASLRFRLAITRPNDTLGIAMAGDDKLRIMISENCGTTWTEVFQVNKDSVTSRFLKTFTADLGAYANKDIRIAFFASSGPVNDGSNYDLHVDNVYIVTNAGTDIGIASFVSPSGSCGLTSSTPVTVLLRNFGTSAQTGFSVSYSVNGSAPVVEAFPGNLAPGASTSFTFAQAANLSLSNSTLKAWTNLVNDQIAINDSVNKTLRTFSSPSSIVGFTGFNGFNLSSISPGWSEETGVIPAGTSSSWALAFLASESVAKIRLAGGNVSDWIVSPGIQLGSTAYLNFFAALQNTAGTATGIFDVDDKINVLVSTNCGQSWTSVFLFQRNGSRGLNSGLKAYTVNLQAYANQEVRIAIRATDGTRSDFTSDFYLDDIQITKAPWYDLSPVALLSPLQTDWIVGQEYPVNVRVKNLGVRPSAPFLVTAALGTNNISTNFPTSLQPGDSADVFVGNMIPVNTISTKLLVYSKLVLDQNINNDTLRRALVITSVVSDKISGDFDLNVYPNPGTGLLYIDSHEMGEYLNGAEAEVIDMSGKKVGQYSLNNSVGSGAASKASHYLDVTDLKSGVYMLRISGERFGNRVFRLIRQ